MAIISHPNSSDVPLDAGEEFVGAFVQVSGAFATVSVLIHSDQQSATGGLQFEWSTDGVNVDDRQSFDYAGSASQLGLMVMATVRAANMRVRYVNNSLTDQTFMRLQTLLHDKTPSASISYLGQAVTANDDVLVTKAVLAARRVDSPADVVLPFATNDPFLIIASPPNTGVIFQRSVFASTFPTQLDFFGIGGANRKYMSVHNNANADLYLNMNSGTVSTNNFTERLKPGDTWRLPLSWPRYGGPVFGLWVATTEVVSAVKFARLRATAIGDTIIVPAVAGAKIRVLGYTVTTQTSGAAVDLFFKSGASTDLASIRDIDGLFPVSYAGGQGAPAFETAAGAALVVGLTAAKQIDGHLSYVEVAPGVVTGNAQVIELL